jgi:hypothetical protein
MKALNWQRFSGFVFRHQWRIRVVLLEVRHGCHALVDHNFSILEYWDLAARIQCQLELRAFFFWSPAAVFESAVAVLVCNSVFGLVCGPRQRSDSSRAPETRWTLAFWTGISSTNRAPPRSHDQSSLSTVSHMTLMEPVVLWVEQ